MPGVEFMTIIDVCAELQFFSSTFQTICLLADYICGAQYIYTGSFVAFTLCFPLSESIAVIHGLLSILKCTFNKMNVTFLKINMLTA